MYFLIIYTVLILIRFILSTPKAIHSAVFYNKITVKIKQLTHFVL